jgi:hypothetical protein
MRCFILLGFNRVQPLHKPVTGISAGRVRNLIPYLTYMEFAGMFRNSLKIGDPKLFV